MSMPGAIAPVGYSNARSMPSTLHQAAQHEPVTIDSQSLSLPSHYRFRHVQTQTTMLENAIVV
ncbi:MAG: hypothetical protein KME27_06035 [Lyngbya sp. HA4199-MV5]|nr:hypothetical protein [Lyngbya sp. HA4199-MV5]